MGLKEDLVECATVCIKIWVILIGLVMKEFPLSATGMPDTGMTSLFYLGLIC